MPRRKKRKSKAKRMVQADNAVLLELPIERLWIRPEYFALKRMTEIENHWASDYPSNEEFLSMLLYDAVNRLHARPVKELVSDGAIGMIGEITDGCMECPKIEVFPPWTPMDGDIPAASKPGTVDHEG